MRSREIRKLIGTDTLVDAKFVNGNSKCIGGKVTREHQKSKGWFEVVGVWDREGAGHLDWFAMARDIRLHVPAKKTPEVGSAEWAEEMGQQGKRVKSSKMSDGAYMAFHNGRWKFAHPLLQGGSAGWIYSLPPTGMPEPKAAARVWSLFKEPAAEQPKHAPTFQVGDVVDATWGGWKISGGKIGGSETEDGWFTVEGKWTNESGDTCWDMSARAGNIRHHVAKEEAKVAPHIVPIAANIRDAIEAMKRVKAMAEIEIGRLEALIK